MKQIDKKVKEKSWTKQKEEKLQESEKRLEKFVLSFYLTKKMIENCPIKWKLDETKEEYLHMNCLLSQRLLIKC